MTDDQTKPATPDAVSTASRKGSKRVGGKRSPMPASDPIALTPSAETAAIAIAAATVPEAIAAPEPVEVAPRVEESVPVEEPAPAVEAAASEDAASVAAIITTEAPAEPALPQETVAEPATLASEETLAPEEPEDIMMDTTTTTATPAVDPRALFTDLGGRAKEAMEKGSKMFEEMNAFGKGNVEAIVESGKIAVKGFEALGQEAAEFTRKSFEGASEAMKTLAATRSPTEFVKLQSNYARSMFDAMVAETSRSTEAMIKLANDVAQPISNRVALAAEKVKMAA